ncbi:MAG: alpha-2-macroglobulin family protein [Chloroflexota bacterium]|nr:alpha-2-macroglobulin family protein [Chloroflexota bacterium]
MPLSYQGNSLAPGFYFLRVSSQDIIGESDKSKKLFLVVSENNLVMKISPDQALVWATRLEDYSPLSDAPISIYNTEGNLVTSGQMDAYGLFQSSFERIDKPYSNFFSLVGEPGQEDFAFSISTWGASSILYEMGISYDTLPALMDAYIYTDRPIYRPGDTIFFKALIFSRDNGLLLSSNLDTVNLSIYSEGGVVGVPDEIYSKDLFLNQYGTVEDQVVLSSNAPTGMYRIEVVHEETAIKTLYFDVAAYRKPNIELAVNMDENDILNGDDFTGDVQADYYFGLLAGDESFSWALYSDDAYFYLPGYRVGPMNTGWLLPEPMDYSPLGSTVASGEGTTDIKGQASLAFSTADLLDEESQQGSLNEITLEVTIADESGLPVSYRHSALIHPEVFYIGVQPETYFGRANTAFDFSVLTVDWNKQVVGNKALEAAFETIEWQVEETPSIELPYRYVEQTSLIGTSSPITDSEGTARVSFTPPDPGTYRLTLKSGDAVTQVLVWVYGESGAVWPRQSQNRINLTADAADYQPGQIAQVFIPNPFEGEVKALVTVERGLVMETQVLTITGAGHMLPVHIEEKSIPNVYVSVVLLGKDAEDRSNYRQGMLNLLVTPLPKTLNIDLSILPAETAPGETVSATLTITDVTGNPVQGEFSIAVVDKALLALVEANSLPILEALYADQPLSVQTSLSLKTYASQLALTNLDLGRGGGEGMGEQPVLREDFPDTAFWQANVITGADGTAQISIPMPDTLTTWVVNVRGLSEDYMVGQTEAEILTQKDLMIQPVTPRFLVDGDEVEMSALVFNNTQQSLTVDVTLQSVGFMLIDGIQETQTVTIDPGDHEPVTWRGMVSSVEMVSLVFKADSGDYADASAPIWGDLEVKRYVMPYTFSTTGQIADEGNRLELVSLPLSTDPSSGELLLELTPSLSATLVEGLEALENHTFDDTVSILSRLLANLNAYLALSDLGIDAPELEVNLADLVDEAIQKLLAAQNYDGGWSWWVKAGSANTNSDVFITAYVLLGLEGASEAGLDVGEGFVERAVEFLSGRLAQPGSISASWELDQLSFQLYALRNRLSIADSLIDGLYARRSELSPWSLGLLGLTVREFEGMSDRVATLMADLEAMAIRSATGVHWESNGGTWLLPGTVGFNTAVGVYTLAQLNPASTSLSLALQYLVNLRQSDGLWPSTFESAWSLMAITEALKGTGDYQAEFNFQASLNDILIAEGAAEGLAPMTAVTTALQIDALFPDSPNALLIERDSGSGTLYYRVDLQTYQLADSAEAVNRGISLQRDYYLVGESCLELEECEPIESLTLDLDDPSQIIKVVLTVTTSHDMFNFLLEDFIPAGTEILNRNLLTSQTLTEDILPTYNPRLPFINGWGWWLFNSAQICDDQILWTADYVPAGTYTLTYELVPYLRGAFQVLPAHAWQYFYPEVQGTSAGELFTID